MTINTDEILRIANLAKLQPKPDSTPKLAQQLEDILNMIEKMEEVDTNNVSPLFHSVSGALPQELTAPLRKDEANQPNQREDFQKIAPSSEAGVYLVNKVIE